MYVELMVNKFSISNVGTVVITRYSIKYVTMT